MWDQIGSKEDDDNDRRQDEGVQAANLGERKFLKLGDLADGRRFQTVEVMMTDPDCGRTATLR